MEIEIITKDVIKQNLRAKDIAIILGVSYPTIFHKLTEFFGLTSLVKARRVL